MHNSLLRWENSFSSIGDQPLSETLQISAAGVRDTDSAGEYSAYWRETFDGVTVAATNITQDGEPKFIEYHFEDLEGMVIGQDSIRTNQKIELVIATENAHGRTITINLNNSKLDFIYKNRVIENDLLRGVHIDKDETRISLIAIKQ